MRLQNFRVTVSAFFTVLGVCVSSAGVRAQTPSAQPTPTTPFLRATRHEQIEFSRSPKRTLHTWYIESRGAGMVEARVWYIANGKANLRDQWIVFWDKKPQSGTWRLLMLEQAAPKPLMLPSYELTTVFDDAKNAPNSKMTGLANDAARKPVRLPAAFNAVVNINDTVLPGISPNRPHIFYAAQPLRRPGDLTAVRQMRGDEANPVETLTNQSRAPGTAFLVLTVLWKPAQK